MEIPIEVSGRKVTPRGVHLQPFGFHDWDTEYWCDLFVKMGLSWVVILTEGDAARKSGKIQALLEHGIIPIVRPSYKLPKPWTFYDEVAALKTIYSQYGAPLVVQFANEPFDPREWKDGEVPPEDEAWALIAQRWHEMANLTVARGAIAGFPDGPAYDDNPFLKIGDADGHWQNGNAVYLAHVYPKGRPIDYPNDPVTMYGEPLSMEDYVAALDIMGNNPYWNEGPGVLALMNQQRADWADPNGTPVQDPVCFRGFEQILHFSREAFGYEVQIALTEGGWCPRDRAGSDPVDIRWPYTTPWMVAKKHIHAEEYPHPYFAYCPWLAADEDMGGAGGWSNDAWQGYAFEPEYGRQKPIIATLKSVPAGGRTVDIEVIDRYGNPQPWSWVVDNYGPIIITDFEGPGYKVIRLTENADVGMFNYRSTRRGRKLVDVVNKATVLAERDHKLADIDAAAVIIVKVLDGDGNPQEGIAVPWYWPDAMLRDTCLPPNGLPPEIPVLRFDGPGITNAAGDMGAAMGSGAYYFPPNIGPHAVWICVPGVATQFVIGLGMLGGTNHFSLWPTFQYIDEPEPPPPPDCRYEELLALLTGVDGDLLAAGRRISYAKNKAAGMRTILEG